MRNRRKNRHAFTLVELLVVVAIITMLAGMVSAAAMSARRRAAVTKAKSLIATLETAIAMYESDTGKYPESGMAQLITELQGPSGARGWDGPYMRFKQDDLEGGVLIDSWGEPIEYSAPGGADHDHQHYFDLRSKGLDREAGSADDLVNW
ncbi:MAG: type II secretion system protein GspG [Candidatus Omnitrophica bacterium]|nr:type II secretion system protein GspG [Candidatus Omnitrophota bacterium]